MNKNIGICVMATLVVSVMFLIVLWNNSREQKALINRIEHRLSEMDSGNRTHLEVFDDKLEVVKSDCVKNFSALEQKLGEMDNGNRENLAMLDSKIGGVERLVAAKLTGNESELTDGDKRIVAEVSLESQLTAVSNCLEKARAFRDKDNSEDVEEYLPIISFLLQTATRELSRAHALDMRLMPPNGMDMLKDAAAEIAREENEFNLIKSRMVMDEVKGEYEAATMVLDAPRPFDVAKKPDQACSNCLKELEKHMFAIQSSIPRIYSHYLRTQAEEKLKLLNAKYVAVLKERNRHYQEYAIHYCSAAFEKYLDTTGVSDRQAIGLVKDYLMDIDPALLVPDVSRLYQEVLGKLLGELPWKKRAELEIEMAKYAKKTLEDF